MCFMDYRLALAFLLLDAIDFVVLMLGSLMLYVGCVSGVICLLIGYVIIAIHSAYDTYCLFAEKQALDKQDNRKLAREKDENEQQNASDKSRTTSTKFSEYF